MAVIIKDISDKGCRPTGSQVENELAALEKVAPDLEKFAVILRSRLATVLRAEHATALCSGESKQAEPLVELAQRINSCTSAIKRGCQEVSDIIDLCEL